MAHRDEAWVTFATDETHLRGSLILLNSLRRTCTNRKVILIADATVAEKLGSNIQAVFDEVHFIPWTSHLEYSPVVYALSLIHLKKVVLINPSSLVLQPADEIFAKASTCIHPKGTTILQPNLEKYGRILQVLLSAKSNYENGTGGTIRDLLSSERESTIEVKYSTNVSQLEEMTVGEWMMADPKIVIFDPKMKGQGSNITQKLDVFRSELESEVESLTQNTVCSKPMIGSTGIQWRPYPTEPIAVVGMSCRMPGANNLEEYWNLFAQGICAVREIPEGRWTKDQLFGGMTGDEAKTQAGFLSCSVDQFDTKFFGLSPLDAKLLDPQQRLLLEVSWEALEEAGIPPASLKGSNTGVFSGMWTLNYRDLLHTSGYKMVEGYRAYSGNSIASSAARLSHFYQLCGPSIGHESACSTSGVSVGMAVDCLRKGKVELALACGVNLLLEPYDRKQGFGAFLSSEQRCKVFDEGGDGFVRAEGCGVLVLKRLSDAMASGDKIHALIRGCGISQEGCTGSMGTPTVQGESLAMELALKDAAMGPEDVGVVEAHGTGTTVGDPLEVSAITKVYASKKRERPLVITSGKANTGHTESCSGIAGLIKTILQMKHRAIPPQILLSNMKVGIKADLDRIPAIILTSMAEWEREGEGVPRVAGVNSFGITGTDTHTILQEAPMTSRDLTKQRLGILSEISYGILTLCAKSASGLDKVVDAYTEALKNQDDLRLCELAQSTNTGRSTSFNHKLAVWGSSPRMILEKLEKRLWERSDAKGSEEPPSLCFVFTGQGSQYKDMGRGLYDSCPVFQTEFDTCEKILKELYGIQLKEALWGTDDLHSSLYSQSAIFVIEYCLVQLWKSWGIVPNAVLGHSLGEFAAATTAGIIKLEDALKLLGARCRLIDALPRGKMVAVMASFERVEEILAEFQNDGEEIWLDIAAINSPSQVTLSGTPENVVAFDTFCKNNGIKTHILEASHAFHSRMMDPMLEPYREVASSLEYGVPMGVGYISGVKGKTLGAKHLVSSVDAQYWIDHTRGAVQFSKAAQAALESGNTVYLEVGPHPVLSSLMMQNAGEKEIRVLPSLRRPRTPSDKPQDWETMLDTIGKLWTLGYPFDFRELHRFSPKLREGMTLPFYPFNREMSWFTPLHRQRKEKQLNPLLGSKLSLPQGNSDRFENCLSLQKLVYLADHKIGKYALLPAAGFVELSLAAINTQPASISSYASSNLPILLEGVAIKAPLPLEESTETDLQTLVSSDKVQVFSRATGSWKEHSEAKFATHEDILFESFSTVQSRCTQEQDIGKIYKSMAGVGYNFGDLFQSIKVLQSGEKGGELLASIQIPLEAQDPLDMCHPIAIDGMIQSVIMSNLLDEGRGLQVNGLYLPIFLRRFVLFSRNKATHFFVHVGPGAEEKTATLYAQDGTVLAQMTGLEFAKTSLGVMERVLASNSRKNLLPPLYEEVWGPDNNSASELSSRFDPSDQEQSTLGHISPSPSDLLTVLKERVLRRWIGEDDRILQILQIGSGTDLLTDLPSLVASAGIQSHSMTYAHPTEITMPTQPEGVVYRPIAPLNTDLRSQGFFPAEFDLVVVTSAKYEGQGDASLFLRNVRTVMKKGSRLAFCMGQNESVLEKSEFFGNVLQVPSSGILLADSKDNCPLLSGLKEERNKIWMVLGDYDNSSLPGNLFQTLESFNFPVIQVSQAVQGRVFKREKGGHVGLPSFSLRMDSKADLELLFLACHPFLKKLEGIVYIPPQAGDKDHVFYSKAILSLLQVLHPHDLTNLRIVVVTRGAVYVREKDEVSNPASCVVGVVKAFIMENPGSPTKIIDVDRDTSAEDVALELWRRADDGEEALIAFRGGVRFRPRLVPSTASLPFPPLDLPLSVSENPRFNLLLPESHAIADLKFEVHDRRRTLGPFDVEVEVKAAALNFRDIFSVLKPTPQFSSLNCVGLDFSGVVVAVGSKVTKRKVGDAVIGINTLNEAMPSHVAVHEEASTVLPPHMTFADGASLPTAFFTAYHCLVTVGKLREGETILIHTASGGVGLAAVQIAQGLGATIIGTAGSPRKRDYLMSLGIQHVFNSRDISFGERILKVTQDKGVQMVLNSLTGPGFKEASLGALSPGGRFVEMSKLNIWTKEEVAELRPDVVYTVEDLSMESKDAQVPGKFLHLFSVMEESLQKISLKPLPHHRFATADIRSALDYLQKAKHIGKVVCVHPTLSRNSKDEEAVLSSQLFNDRATYVVTGGCGGIGFEVAKWMVAEEGARNLVLWGRKGLSPDKQKILDQLKTQFRGVNILVVQGDVGNLRQCKRVFKQIEDDTELPPVRGIFHCAGTLADATIPNQSMDKFADVFSPKINGALNLAEFTKSSHLECFVLFSSVVSLVGSPGQSNYVAANSWLDSFAAARRSSGLPTICINWGLWGEVGMGLHANSHLFKPFSTREGLNALGLSLRNHAFRLTPAILDTSTPVLAMMPWVKAYLEKLNNSNKNKRCLEHSVISSDDFWEELNSAEKEEERRAVIQWHLEKIIQRLLHSEEILDKDFNFQDAGMDSLMMIEMRNSLQSLLGKTVTVKNSDFADCFNITSTTDKVMKLVYHNCDDIREADKLERLRQIREDSILFDTIGVEGRLPAVPVDEIKTVLVTGCTGNMGPYVVSHLARMEQIQKVICLVRPSSTESGEVRLLTRFKVLGLDLGDSLGKIQVVEGDVAKERMGIEESLYPSLASQVHAIFHCAVKASHVDLYGKGSCSLRAVNVTGTQRMLEFATHTRLKQVCLYTTFLAMWIRKEDLVDTDSAPEHWPQENDIDDAPNFGYGITKFISDRLVTQAVALGVPCKAFRFAKVFGAEKTGIEDFQDDHFFKKFVYFTKSGLMPDFDILMQCTPVDTSVSMSLTIFFNPTAPPELYHVYNPHMEWESDLELISEEYGSLFRVGSVLPDVERDLASYKAGDGRDYANKFVDLLVAHAKALEGINLTPILPTLQDIAYEGSSNIMKETWRVLKNPEVRSYLTSNYGQPMRFVPYKEFEAFLLKDERSILKRWHTFYAKGDSFYKLAGQFFKENKANLKRDPVPVFENSLKKTLTYIPNVREVCPTNLSILRTGFEYALENAVDFFRL